MADHPFMLSVPRSRLCEQINTLLYYNSERPGDQISKPEMSRSVLHVFSDVSPRLRLNHES